ncbi:MAG: hypothetical protein ACKO7W_00610 [Elainella sp.]
MKTPIVLVSIGLLSSTLASVTGYMAWNSLRGQPNATPVVATAQSQPSLISPIAPSYAPVVNVAPATPAPAPAPTTWSQPENDYLFDLSQALQPQEYQRLTATQQLDIARQIQTWITAGTDFWSLRQQFDATYRGAIVGDYAHNREVYIRFTAERFAPGHLASLMLPPGPSYGEFYGGRQADDPYAPPYSEPVFPEDYGQPFPPYPAPYGYAPYPEAYGFPESYPPYPMPAPGYSNPGYPNPEYGNPAPNGPQDSYPGDSYGWPGPRQPQTPQPNSPPQPDRNPNIPNPNIPNLTEVST